MQKQTGKESHRDEKSKKNIIGYYRNQTVTKMKNYLDGLLADKWWFIKAQEQAPGL